MAKEIDPKQTKRAPAFELWMKAPMPMVTLFKTLDVTRLVRVSRKSGCKFHMLMCWCIGKAAAQTEEFYILPVGDKLMQYDKLAVNTVVTTRDGELSTCDIPYSDHLEQFNLDYLRLTQAVCATGEAYCLGEDWMVIGTSALAGYEIRRYGQSLCRFLQQSFSALGEISQAIFKHNASRLFSISPYPDGRRSCRTVLARLQDEMNRLTL